MKIHPLFEKLLFVPSTDDDPTLYSDWVKAGKPVVEEETPIRLPSPPMWPCCIQRDARIRELEAKLAAAEEDGHHCSGCCAGCARQDHAEVRNAALEEAAKACWPHQQFNPESGSETLLMQTASRIRALKKETK